MHILITGINGFVGSHLARTLLTQGHQITALTRSGAAGNLSKVRHNSERGKINSDQLNSHQLDCQQWDFQSVIPASFFAQRCFDAVIHLAGEPINQRWTPIAKTKIMNSRVDATRFLMQSLRQQSTTPRVVVTASAIGFYGDRGNEVLDESAARGSGFLADVCAQWEQASRSQELDSRIINLRFGMILSRDFGALAQMLLPFKLGLGARLGNGMQHMSWIDIDDAVQAIVMLLNHPTAQGPFNIVAPETCTNRSFTKELGRVLSRPSFFVAPAWLLKIILGDLSHLVLDSVRVTPKKLTELSFQFNYPTLSLALRNHLTRRP